MYKEEFKGFSYETICRKLRTMNELEWSFKMKMKRHPKIILYYVINNKNSRENVAEKFDYFRSLLKHIFLREGAVLHIIGFSEINEIEEFKK